MRGLPALIPYVALSGYRRPGLPEGLSWLQVKLGHKKPGAVAGCLSENYFLMH